MNLFTTSGAITITSHKRITPYLEQEVKELGFTVDDSFVTGVKLTGTINDCVKLNLNLRCASQDGRYEGLRISARWMVTESRPARDRASGVRQGGLPNGETPPGHRSSCCPPNMSRSML